MDIEELGTLLVAGKVNQIHFGRWGEQYTMTAIYIKDDGVHWLVATEYGETVQELAQNMQEAIAEAEGP